MKLVAQLRVRARRDARARERGAMRVSNADPFRRLCFAPMRTQRARKVGRFSERVGDAEGSRDTVQAAVQASWRSTQAVVQQRELAAAAIRVALEVRDDLGEQLVDRRAAASNASRAAVEAL